MKGPEMAKLLRDLGFENIKTHMTVLDDADLMIVEARLLAQGLNRLTPEELEAAAAPKRKKKKKLGAAAVEAEPEPPPKKKELPKKKALPKKKTLPKRRLDEATSPDIAPPAPAAFSSSAEPFSPAAETPAAETPADGQPAPAESNGDADAEGDGDQHNRAANQN